MRRGIITLLFTGFLLAQVHAQVNLIPNGGFESYSPCPTSLAQIERATDWYTPTTSTPDYINGCATSPLVTIPPITSDNVYPFNGDGMAGLSLIAVNNVREYVACGLAQPLMAQNSYELKMRLHVRNSDFGFVGSIGALFSIDTLEADSGNHPLIDQVPQIQRDPTLIMYDVGQWIEFVDTLEADGGENHVTIGNFLSNAETPFVGDSLIFSYYYLDDVELTWIGITGINEVVVDAHISPNPTSEQVFINSRHSELELSVMSIDGQVIRTELLIGQGSHPLNIGELASGPYLIRLRSEKGERVEKLVVR